MTASVVSFVDLIFHHALARPEKPAIVLADRVATYDMMAQGILRVEERLRTLDLPPGALVCVSLESPIRLMIVGAALFRLGHPVLSVAKPLDILSLQLPIGYFLQAPEGPPVPGARQAAVDDGWFVGERRSITASPPKGFANEQAIALVALSSGTTGRPKAVSLSIKAFQQWVMNYYSTLGLGTWDRFLNLIGLTSSWGFTLAAHALFAGRTLLHASTARDALQMIAVYSADAMAATSQQLRELAREQARAPVPCTSLRVILTGGGLLSRTMMTEARAALCSNIVNLYGSTEAGGTAFANADQLTAIDGATGFVAPWAEVEIVDQHGNVLSPDTEGTVRIHATCQGAPYPPGRPEVDPSFHGAWFYPGDRARITRDGLMILTGRTSNIINVGGLKLAPEVIEDTLREHPAVADAAAFGAMGSGGIEEISVVLVARAPVDERTLVRWSAERGIPLARVFTADALPQTPSGKVDRDLLKREYLK